MSGFKKIVVTSFRPTGELSVRMTLSLRVLIDGSDYANARATVEKILVMHPVSTPTYSVEWMNDGVPQGYLVSPLEPVRSEPGRGQ